MMTLMKFDTRIIDMKDCYHIKYLPMRTDINWPGTLRFHYHSPPREIFIEGSEAKEMWDAMDEHIKNQYGQTS